MKFLTHSVSIIILLILLISCESNQPNPICENSGKFIMTLNNEQGRIIYDPVIEEHIILFSTEGKLDFDLTGWPCNLKPEFRDDLNVTFDADIFELKGDSNLRNGLFSMYINNIEYR